MHSLIIHILSLKLGAIYCHGVAQIYKFQSSLDNKKKDNLFY